MARTGNGHVHLAGVGAAKEIEQLRGDLQKEIEQLRAETAHHATMSSQ
ncbi:MULTISPECIES: hypothetical protein [unclassified Ectothiorhodospira]|nr:MULTISPECIES: hypothetical protein [unclassified Ectothiorhodospira]MCG5517166.1 hypothetical protein [Ectothiorhodospira sp. 9100]MCG5520380.1 hypothetical protein [Ectothiorhodospira sp. 9905]